MYNLTIHHNTVRTKIKIKKNIWISLWIRLLKNGLWRILVQEAGILLFLMTMEVEKQGMCAMENSHFLSSY